MENSIIVQPPNQDLLFMPMARPATFTAQNDIKYVVDATSVGNKKVAQTVKICSEISMK